MPIASDVQKPDVGEFITLYDLDATPIGGGVFYFVQATLSGSVVVWRGNSYTPLDIEAEGFEISGQGTLPTPKLRVSNVTKAMSAAIFSVGDDMLGARLTRWRTLKKYLDGQSHADPNAHFPPDIYVLQRKAAHNKHLVEWELSSILDYEGQKLPRRQVLRDICTHVYRYWSGAGFDYSSATCPYAGAVCWNVKREPVTDAEDRCGKRLGDCKLRFPDQALPTTAFPGVARTRIY